MGDGILGIMAGLRADTSSPNEAEGGSWYDAFGLRIRSAVPLPMAPSQEGRPADVTIRVAAPEEPEPIPTGPIVSGIACSHGTIHYERLASDRGTLLRNRLAGTMLIDPSHTTVTVFPPSPNADQKLLGLFLAGSVAIFIRSRSGTPVLHCSAVVTKQGVAVFLGDHGQGKSTTAAYFLSRGAELLTDDALPLEVGDEQILGIPGPGMMKLWDASIEHVLHLDRSLPDLCEGVPKKLLQIDDTFFAWLTVRDHLRQSTCLIAVTTILCR